MGSKRKTYRIGGVTMSIKERQRGNLQVTSFTRMEMQPNGTRRIRARGMMWCRNYPAARYSSLTGADAEPPDPCRYGLGK